MNEKNIENKLRRRLFKLGYLLRKSRRRLDRNNWGGYRIVDIDSNAIIAGRYFNLDLDEVEQFAEK